MQVPHLEVDLQLGQDGQHFLVDLPFSEDAVVEGLRLDQLDDFLHERGHVDDASFIFLEDGMLDERQVLEARRALYFDCDCSSVSHLRRQEAEQELDQDRLLNEGAPGEWHVCLAIFFLGFVAQDGTPVVIQALLENRQGLEKVFDHDVRVLSHRETLVRIGAIKLNLLECLRGQHLLCVIDNKVNTLHQDAVELRVSEVDCDSTVGVQVFTAHYVSHLNDELLHGGEGNQQVTLTDRAKL